MMEFQDTMPSTRPVPFPDWLDPTKREMDFLDSSFFQTPGQRLPTTAEVRSLSSDIGQHPHPKPVVFNDLNLLVKLGPCVTIEEALCLWIVKRTLHDAVPVPEIHGWRMDEKDRVYLYMELIHGRTLHDFWQELTEPDKTALRNQLRQIISALRQLGQDPNDKYIGSITRQHPQDYVFQQQPKGGPFSNIKDFNDWFATLQQVRLPESKRYIDPYRHIMPDTGEIKFTHADLHRGNIMVSSSGPARVLAIVDWAQSGWYPDYWEYCKALYTSWSEDEWFQDWVNKVLPPQFEIALVFSDWTMAMGAV